MATPQKKPPEEVLTSLLSNGNAVNPNAQLDTGAWTPQYSQSPEQQAQSRADLEYGSQIRAIQEAARQASESNARSRSIEQGYGREIDPRLKNVYDALGTSLTQRRGETKANYQGAIGNIRGYYDEAVGANQGVNSDVLNRIMQMSSNLGLGAAVPDSIGKLMENYQFEQNQLNQGKAGRSANLESLASEIYGLDTRRIGAAASEGAQARATAQQQVLKTLSDLLFQGEQEQGGFRREVAGLEGDKGKAIAQLIADITDQRNKEGIDARGNALQEFLSRSGLAQSNQQMEEQRRQFDISVQEGAKDRAARSSGGGGGGGSSNPLNDMLKMLQIEKAQRDLNTKELKGMPGLTQWLDSPNDYWTKGAAKKGGAGVFAPKAGPKFRDAVLGIIERAGKLALPKKDALGTVVRQATNPFDRAMGLAGTKDYHFLNPEALREALEIYYKGRTYGP